MTDAAPHIMLVDDEMHVLRILRMSLQKEGYEVHCYSNGQEALNAVRQREPDVLVTDIQMPRMTGEELCKAIAQEFPNRKFAIFVVTSRTEYEHREWSSKIDNLQFLEKPISMRNLISTLGDHFKSSMPGWNS